jgi:hypothetical protein
MVVGFGATELVEALGEILRVLEVAEAGDRHDLVERALKRALGRRPLSPMIT